MWFWALVGCDDFLVSNHASEASDLAPRVVSRLNRAEYDNTVRDLFGTTLRPAVNFPSDDFGYGFDNIADVLSVSPLHVELYQAAAQQLVAELYGEREVAAERWLVEAENAQATGGASHEATRWMLYGEDEVFDRFFLPEAGPYTVASAAGSFHGAPADVVLMVDDAVVASATVTVEQRLEATLDLAAGYHTVSLAYVEPNRAREDDEEVLVDWLEVTGPHGRVAPPPALRDRVLSCTPGDDLPEAACAEQIVRDFGRRAWRRPLTEQELLEQLALYGQTRASGGDFDEGIQAVLQGLLVSPNFIYRIELDPDPTSTEEHPVGPYELATRLSYFLWSSTPDDRLLDLAASGAILDAEVLEAETRRMLKDPRARALVDNLGGQWLGIRKVAGSTPDPNLFPEVDPALLRSMEDEMAALVADVFLGGEPMDSLFTTTRAHVDERLAEFYGLAGAGVVDIPERPGLITRAGILTATSYPTRTSPVKRGAWVLEKVLCSPPPPAPAGVPELEESGGASVIEQLAQHRSDPSCAACHDAMDPIGIGLESFDAIGRVREVYDDGQPVITASITADGASFETTDEFLRILVTDPRVDRCAVRQTFTYALGRSPVSSDDPVLAELVSVVEATGSFEELLVGIVQSKPFRTRRGGP